MEKRVIRINEREYKKFEAVAKMLEAMSEKGARYIVKDVYLDFGQDWMWTTICRTGEWGCQILSPRQWEDIMMAQTSQDLAKIVDDIRAGKYFHE